MQARIESLEANMKTLRTDVRYLQDIVDTYLHSNLLKRLWFVVDGWPADRIASQPKRRWWHR